MINVVHHDLAENRQLAILNKNMLNLEIHHINTTRSVSVNTLRLMKTGSGIY